MKTHEQYEKSSSIISNAVEMLSAIAELDIEKENVNTKDNTTLYFNKNLRQKKINWINNSNTNDAIKIINETFSTVLNYLKFSLEGHAQKSQNLEVIKSIMLLVVEAAKKFDRYRELIYKENKSITEFKPYKELQEFYQTKIMHQVGTSTLGKWILGLSQRRVDKIPSSKHISQVPIQTKHTFVDLDAIKKDSDYELFFIRKEDGNHFFNARLIRNIKLICNFGDSQAEKTENNLIGEFEHLESQAMQLSAQKIFHSLYDICETFYRNAFKFKNKMLVNTMGKALMALMLAKNAENLVKDENGKDCHDYFIDFHQYLRIALESADYHRLITYPPNEGNVVDTCLIDLINGICRQLYLSLAHFQEVSVKIQELIHRAKVFDSNALEEAFPLKNIAELLQSDYNAMTKLLQKQLQGPIAKVLDALSDGNYSSFDPFLLSNWPNKLYLIQMDGQTSANIYLPSPTHQEYINKVGVVEEFKGLLRSYANGHSKHLIVNFQDRTSWKEFFRCLTLEDLQQRPEFANSLEVITLAADTDFYHQLPPYDKDNHTEVFFRHFEEHLGDVNSGFYFPPALKKEILGTFSQEMMKAMHRIFFSSKNILLVEHRQAFLDIFYTLLILKTLDIIKPFSFSLTCKDGIDGSICSNILLYLFLKMLAPEPLSSQDWQHVNMMLYGPSLLVRERTLQPESFKRMVNSIKVLEFAYHEYGHKLFGDLIREAFGLFFDSSILNGTVLNTK